MSLVRILVDGYSLLNHWAGLAPGKPRQSSAAREELIHKLTQYCDAGGTPITIIFDGVHGPPRSQETASSPEVEILFSHAGQAANQTIERVAHRFRPQGEVLVVTDDQLERDLVLAGGGQVSNCQDFIQTVESTLAEIEQQIALFNQRERLKFNAA